MVVSFIVVVFNEASSLAAVHAALQKLKRPDDIDIETIAVDGGSRDGSVEAAQNAGFSRVVELPGANIPTCRNAGIRAARGDWIAFVDGDCILDEDWLLHAARLLNRHQPLILGWPASPPTPGTWVQRAWYAHWMNKHPALEKDQGEQVLKQQGFRMITTRNMICHRDVMDRIGGFDESLDDQARIDLIHNNKTGALIHSSCVMGALTAGAEVVITGRVADPALFLAPLIHEFGWSMDQYDLLGKGTVLGHLLECAGQVCGGYFADPGVKEVPDPANLGFPIAEVDREGDFVITKLPDAGGLVTPATCKEQLLYEIHNPAEYLTPDVIADLTGVKFRETAKDRVAVSGGSGRAKTGLLKVSVGFRDGYIGEGQISYGGPGAVARGQLALDIVKQRLADTGVRAEELRFDLMGVNSLYGNTLDEGKPAEVRLRVAGRTASRSEAVRIGNEVESLYTNGPAGGGGALKSVSEVIAIHSILIDATEVEPVITYKTV